MPTTSVIDASIKTKISATPNNYGVTHIAIDTLPDNVAWTKAILVRKYTGYPQNINDGDQIKTINNTNAIVNVTATTGVTKKISTITKSVNLSKNFTYPAATSTSVTGISVGTSSGKDALFSVNSSGTITLDASDASFNFIVNDLVTVKTDVLMGLSETYQPNDYGLAGYYHVYDTLGTSTSVSSNPGTVTASESAQGTPATRTYYSLFIEYCTAYDPATDAVTKQWKKAGETSALLIKDAGTVATLLSHLPSFYTSESQTNSGNDLEDFLKVFAFQLDLYKTQARNVFTSTDVLTADEELLKLLLKEFGVNYANVGELAQARTLASNIIKIYKQSGSILGLETLIEAYTGYGTNITVGRNLLIDYNSATFEENTGFWTRFYELENTFPSFGITLTAVGTVDNGVVAFSDAQAGYGSVTDAVTGASCSTTSTLVTGTYNSSLKVGSLLSLITGSGTLQPGTLVTSLVSTNTFTISAPPTVALSSATLRASSNMIGGMAKLTTSTTAASTTPAQITLGKKQATVPSTTTGTTTIVVSPPIAEVDDYIFIDNTNPVARLSTLAAIPYGATVSSISTSSATTQTLVLSSKVTTVPAGTKVGFSRFAADPVGASGALIPIEEGKPYAFSAYVYAQSSLLGTAVATTSANLYFMNQLSQITSSIAGTTVAISSAASTVDKWVPITAQAVASAVNVYPASATTLAKVNYVSPALLVQGGITSTVPIYIDAVQLDGPLHVVAKQIPTATTAKITTETAHGYAVNKFGTTSSSYVTVTGLGSPFDGTFPITAVAANTVTYSISTTTTQAASIADGYCASSTAYQDPREVNIDVLPNRINLITNPSFELDTNFWGTASVANTTAGVNCVIIPVTSDYYVGSKCMSMTSTGTSPISVYGYAGTLNSGVVSSYTTTFTVDRSTTDQEIQYAFSFYAKSAATPRPCFAEIYWYKDEAGSLPSDETVVSTGTSVTTSISDWSRVSVVGTSPKDAKSAKVRINITSNASSEVHYIDAALFEKAYSVAFYFDGDYDGQNYTSDRDSVWETGGIANKCRSHFYLNRVDNTGRLNTILTDGVYYA